jgi:hypothetical protein
MALASFRRDDPEPYSTRPLFATEPFSRAWPAIAPFGGRLHMVYLGNTSTHTPIFHTSSDGTLSVIRIGFKFVVPSITNINSVLAEARVIFGSKGFSIEEAAPREQLTVAVDLHDLDVNDCVMSRTTREQNELFTFRNNLGPRDIAVYVVDTLIHTDRDLAGCATHPDDVPACLIEDDASVSVMAHEIGHVLGLRHVDDSNNLMRPGKRTNPPPDLTVGQALTIQDSHYSRE